jgi:multidrug efflux pump subunit AcrA (membrane-fusion protein)
MKRKSLALPCLVLLGWLLAGGTPADDGSKSDKAAPKPATAKVEKSPFKVEVALKGIVESAQMTEVSVKPEAWASPLVVKKAVEHGTPVKKGDVLVEIDLEKLDQALRDLKAERALAELAIQQAQEELPVMEKQLPLDLAAAERAKRQADEDLKKFLDVDRPLSVESAEQSVKNATYSVESAREELKQLQKMYRDKDLTEETEEFILKRQRHFLAMAEFQLRTSKTRQEQTLKLDLPRQEQTLRDNAAKQTVALEKARNTLPLAVSQKRLTLAKLKYDSEKSAEKMRHYQKDREILTIKAPVDGIAYYGKCVRGQWTTAAVVGPKLQRGGMLQPEEVFLTLVSPRPIFVRAIAEEKDLHFLKPGLTGKVIPAGYPDVKLAAHLESVSAVPFAAGSFDARVAIEAGDTPGLMPGMACTVKLTAYQKKDALTVPAAAVFTDENEDDARYVYLARKNDKPEKRTVKVGKTANGKAEILDGLKEGDEILTSKPEDRPSEKAAEATPVKSNAGRN